MYNIIATRKAGGIARAESAQEKSYIITLTYTSKALTVAMRNWHMHAQVYQL